MRSRVTTNEVIRGNWVVVTLYPKNPLKPYVHVYGPYDEEKARTLARQFQEHNFLNPKDQSLVYVKQEMRLSDD